MSTNHHLLPATAPGSATNGALTITRPTQPISNLPASVTAAAQMIASWDNQPLFTMPQALADEMATAIENARQDIGRLFLPTDPRDVALFMTKLATRRNLDLPTIDDLLADALAVSSKLPADLFDLACQRLWTDFAYRRLPEPADFTRAVKDNLDSRIVARAKIERMEKALAARQALKEKSAAMRRH